MCKNMLVAGRVLRQAHPLSHHHDDRPRPPARLHSPLEVALRDGPTRATVSAAVPRVDARFHLGGKSSAGGRRGLTILPPREEACRQLQLFTCRYRPKRSCLDQSTDLTVGGPVNNYRVVVFQSLGGNGWDGHTCFEWEVGWAPNASLCHSRLRSNNNTHTKRFLRPLSVSLHHIP